MTDNAPKPAARIRTATVTLPGGRWACLYLSRHGVMLRWGSPAWSLDQLMPPETVHERVQRDANLWRRASA